MTGFRPSSSTVSLTPTARAPPPSDWLRPSSDVCDEVVTNVRDGANMVILSDRNTSPTHAAIPSLLLASAVHHRLVDEHLRTSAALIIEAGDVREVHHVALLLGFGASAVCPYLAYESIDALVERAS